MSKSTHTARKSSRQESETDTSMMPPSGPIYLPSTVQDAEAWWTSLQVASLASHTPSPDSAAERLTNAISGPTPLESFAKLDPLSCSLKMCLESSPKPTHQDIYLAGLIDGEGTISIWGKPGKQYYPCIQVGMSEKALGLLQALAKDYGGNVRRFRPATSAWSAGWTWSIFGAEAKTILERIHSSLRLKQAHATLALRLFLLIQSLETPKGKRHRWTTEAREHAAALATMMTELNKKGPTEVSEMVKSHPILDPNNIWVTPQIDFLGMRQSFTGSWPKQGMTVSGVAYRLRPLVPRTSVGGGGASRLPTPNAVDGQDNFPDSWGTKKGTQATNSLAMMAKTGLWPTPNVPNGGRTTWYAEKVGNSYYHDGKKVQLVLEQAARMWPTPRVSDHGNPGVHGQGGQDLRTEVGGQLNPTWVEALMGLPQGWTDISPMSIIEYKKWLMGFTNEILPDLQRVTGAETVHRETRRQDSFRETQTLQPELCEHPRDSNQARLQLEGQETPEDGLRSVSGDSKTDCPPYQSRHYQQRSGQHSDPLQMVPRLLPQYGRQAWQDGSWENGIPRVATGVAHRVDRLRTLGNGIVPAVVARFLT